MKKPVRYSGVRQKRKGAVGRRFKVLRQFVTNGQAQLRAEGESASTVVLWFNLWTFVDSATGTVSIGRRALARLTGCSEATIKRAIRRLLELGYLERLRDGIKGRFACTYRLHPVPPDEGSPMTPDPKPMGGHG